MIAVIIAPGLTPGMEPLNERYPSPLLPLVDRPFIQHVVEFLVEGGITQFEFVLSHLPEKIEGLLGDGSRWGSTFRFHLARDAFLPYDLLKTISFGNNSETFLLAHADRLPQIDLNQTRPTTQQAEPIMFFSSLLRAHDASAAESRDNRQWTGWAWVPVDVLKGLPRDLDEEALESHLASMAQGKGSSVEVAMSLSVRSYYELLASHHAVLGKQFNGLLLGGKEADESIWLSRNVSLHPTATLNPPVYIGDNCRIGKGTRLGPDAVIGKDCVLDSGCTVTGSVIFQGSYVGEGLELANVLIDKNRLINVRYGTDVLVSEDFILGCMSGSRIGQRLSSAFSRVVAACLLLIVWPLLLVTALMLKAFRRGPVLFKKKAVRLPAPSDDTFWRTFDYLSFAPFAQETRKKSKGSRWEGLKHLFLRFLPALISVVKGEVHFVGVSPRSEEELRALSQDWKMLYIGSRVGIVTEAYVNFGATPTEDDLYSAEVFYSVTAGTGHDFKLLLGYLGRILKAGGGKR